jgi:multicomponent Na+:H+ antiporter subunit B
MKELASILLVLALGIVLVIGMDFQASPPDDLKNYYLQNGVEETGSANLVSSIYLGYRAFDTLGESVVLFLAVMGIITIQGENK